MKDRVRLYDESEMASIRFFGLVSEQNRRYDFGIIYTQMFFGKPLVVCMQTGRSSILSLDDIENKEYLQQIYRLSTLEEAEEFALALQNYLPSVGLESEIE